MPQPRARLITLHGFRPSEGRLYQIPHHDSDIQTHLRLQSIVVLLAAS